MCRPKPGLRCSAHASKQYSLASAQLDAVRGINGMKVPASLTLAQAEANFKEAEAEYDATREGYKQLEEKIQHTEGVPSMRTYQAGLKQRYSAATLRRDGRKTAESMLNEARGMKTPKDAQEEMDTFTKRVDFALQAQEPEKTIPPLRRLMENWKKTIGISQKHAMQGYIEDANHGFASGSMSQVIATNEKRQAHIDAQLARLPQISSTPVSPDAPAGAVGRLPQRKIPAGTPMAKLPTRS